MLVKSCRIPKGSSVAALAREGIVDPTFAAIVERARLPWQVLGAGDEDELAALLKADRTPGTCAPRRGARCRSTRSRPRVLSRDADEKGDVKIPRFGWALTGSGHFFKESLAIMRELPDLDVFVSRAAAEVVRMYRQDFVLPPATRIYKDTTASAAPVGNFYYGVYHTLILAPATSNTVAKCVYGISDNLATNVFAQAGKCRVPTIVFACDNAPELDTEAPKGMVKVYPRRIDLENTERLRSFEATTVVESMAELEQAVAARLAWLVGSAGGRRQMRPARWAGAMAHKLLFLTGRLAEPRLDAHRRRSRAAGRLVAHRQRRREGRGADDRGHRAQPPESAARSRPRDRAGARRMDLDQLKDHYGVPFERGPDEIIDLPQYFGKGGKPPGPVALRHAHLRRDRGGAASSRVERARGARRRAQGRRAPTSSISAASPTCRFRIWRRRCARCANAGHKVSVDSGDVEELRRGARAGADYVLEPR